MEDLSGNIVLLVDDNSENIDFLDEALGDLYSIMAATDGFTALEIARTQQPDVILLDIVMPGMDGYDICRRLKEEDTTRHIPVIFLTGKKNLDDKSRGFELGAVDYITKPFEIIEVKARVKNQLIVKRAQTYLEYKNKFLESEVHNRNRELSQTQAELEESEEKFRMLFEKSSNAIAFLQPCFNLQGELEDYIYLDVNPGLIQLLKMKDPQNILHHSEKDIFPLQDQSWFDLFRGTAERGETQVFDIYHPYLEKYLTGSSFKPQQDKGYFCILFNDMTEQVLYQNELLKAKNKAEESDRLKSAFLANISHEIRTPLNGITGFTHLIRQELADNPKQNNYYDIVNSCTKNLITIIDEIIDFARIESGAFYLDYHSISLNKLIQNRADYFRKELKSSGKRNIEIKEILPLPDGKDNFITDKARLNKILNNLMNNAVKFTESGTIWIGYNIDEIHKIVFFVRDTGIGISEESQSFIFQSFRQEKEGYNRDHGGMGLGLAITKKMVDQMGGEIKVQSEKGKGSTFSFSFHSDGLNSDKQNIISKNININEFLQGKTVLVQEKNPLVKENLNKLLSLKNIEKYFSETPMELKRLYREHPEADAIILGLDIYKNSKEKLLDEILDFYGNIGIILYLKEGESLSERTPVKHHALLHSPLDPLELYQSLDQVIRLT